MSTPTITTATTTTTTTTTTTSAPSTLPYHHWDTNFDVVIPISARPQSETALAQRDRIDDDDELSDGTIAQLLREAEERMRNVSASSSGTLKTITTTTTTTIVGSDQNNIRLPRLDPGASLPKPPISSSASGVSRISDRTTLVPEADRRELANGPRPVGSTTSTNKKSKKEPPPTAGSAWYDLPRTELTDSFKRDFALVKHRNVLDPHRHYRKDSSGIPMYSQMGTVIEGNTEFFNARLLRKERKKTILEEVMADGTSRQRFKRKFEDIQKSKKSGKKEFYKKLKDQRHKTAAKFAK